MPKIPSEVPPLPKAKYHRADRPKVRIPKQLVVQILMNSHTVMSYTGTKIHVAVDDDLHTTLCGIRYRGRVESGFMGLPQCQRCFHVYRSVVDYYGGKDDRSQ